MAINTQGTPVMQGSYNPFAQTGLPGSSATTNVSATSAQPIDSSRLATGVNTTVPAPVNTQNAANTLATTVGTYTQGAAANQVQQEQMQQQAPAAPVNQRQGILDKISSLLGVQSTQGEVSQNIYDQEGVFEKKKLVTQLEGEAMAKERAYTKQAEKIRQNLEGKLESGVAIDLNNLERQKNSELADIAIQSKVAMGNYADANQIAEAKVKMQFEPLENQIKTLQNLYQLYGDDMTEGEKMQAEAKIQEKRDAVNFAQQKALISYRAQIETAQKMEEGKALGLSGTAAQFTAANYANRVEQANSVFQQVGPVLKNMPIARFKLALKTPSFLQSPDIQQFSQATKNYVNAVLRRESGAAVSPSEFDTAIKQYIPTPGDSQETLALKEQNRLLVQRNFINESGKAYQPLSQELTPNISGQTQSTQTVIPQTQIPAGYYQASDGKLYKK